MLSVQTSEFQLQFSGQFILITHSY